MTAGGSPAAESSGLIWWRDAHQPLVWSESPEIGAVFDPVSGETHLINDLPALVLRHIRERPLTALQLFEEIAGEPFVETRDRAALEQIVAALKFLATAELVESRSAEMP